MKKKIHNISNLLQTKGFTLIDLLALLVFVIIFLVITVIVISVIEYGSLETPEPLEQVVQPVSTNTSKNQKTQTIGAIQLSKDQRQEELSEEVNVPDGVKVTVKRSRTIARTGKYSMGGLGGIDANVGIKNIVDTSVRWEIKQIKGEDFKESETIEYEIELNGEKSNRYKLIWIDTWRKGSVELREKSTEIQTYFIPFEFVKKGELHVSAIHSD